jgi:hypothetical protein
MAAIVKTIDPLLPGARLTGEPMAERLKSADEFVPEPGPTDELGELPDPQPITVKPPIVVIRESIIR